MNFTDQHKRDGFILANILSGDYSFAAILWIDSHPSPKLLFAVNGSPEKISQDFCRSVNDIIYQKALGISQKDIELADINDHEIIQLIASRISSENMGPILVNSCSSKHFTIPNVFIYKI